MSTLYQHQLRKNLIDLNKSIEPEQIDITIQAITNCIKLNQKYFRENHLKIFDEIVKEGASFEEIFNISLNSQSVQDKRNGDPLLIFLPAALYDICTDHKHDFIGQTNQKLIQIIRDATEHPKIPPDADGLYSNIIECEINRIELETRATKKQASHSLNTGNWLVEFLKSHIELERASQKAVAEEIQKQNTWVNRLSIEASASEAIREASKKKSVSFASSFGKI